MRALPLGAMLLAACATTGERRTHPGVDGRQSDRRADTDRQQAPAAAVVRTVPQAVARHFEGRFWTGALASQAERPQQLALEAGLLGATVALLPFDHRLQQEAGEDRRVTRANTANGDAADAGLAVLATGLGVADWANGDRGQALEVLVESFVASEGATEILKRAVSRKRPTGTGHSSFPSGHTSFAFNMATFVQRRVADSTDGWVGNLGYLAYLPATYVGINRVEADRHWPTDATFAAFLGVFVTNVVYDAHYGSEAHEGLFGVRGLALEPTASADGPGLALALRF